MSRIKLNILPLEDGFENPRVELVIYTDDARNEVEDVIAKRLRPSTARLLKSALELGMQAERIQEAAVMAGVAANRLLELFSPSEPVPCSHCGGAPDTVDDWNGDKFYCVNAFNNKCPGNDARNYTLEDWNAKHGPFGQGDTDNDDA